MKLLKKTWRKLLNGGLVSDFLDMILKAQGKESKSKQVGPHEPGKLLQSRGINQQNKKVTYGNGGNIWKPTL